VPEAGHVEEGRRVKDVGAGSNLNSSTRMGVISEPPPIPVSPTSVPLNSPVRTNCQLME
jgi:hypothetical protein